MACLSGNGFFVVTIHLISGPAVTILQSVITFDEAKRQANIRSHGLDFIGCEAIWDNFTITREDRRHAYGEKRFVTFGLLGGEAVVLVTTDRGDTPHIISLRKAEKYEARYYFETAKDYFSQSR